ncbi:MAG UNVERIFIED_CONTAM: hypothetical protein LVR18_05130 [Planctomycetaceae bacterium]
MITAESFEKFRSETRAQVVEPKSAAPAPAEGPGASPLQGIPGLPGLQGLPGAPGN